VSTTGVALPAEIRGHSPTEEAWRRLRRNRLALAGLVLVTLVTLACVLLPALFTLDPLTTNPALRNQPPSAAHWFGTDGLGRDYAARVLYGGQTSLLVGWVATLTCVIVGVLYGAVSGYYGGKVDEVMMRFVDFMYGIPYMFLVILIMLMFSESARGDPLPVFVALGLVEWLTMARVVRGQILSLREREFVLAARLLGASDFRVIVRHLVPNVMAVVTVYATLTVPTVIILESFLSFLGLGLKLSWGQLVSEAVGVINPIAFYWWQLLFPSGFLAATLLSLNYLGDGLRDAVDPRSR
jgi:oligopeptide transport system permease protein